MVIQFRCEQCGKEYQVADEMRGWRLTCKACAASIRIPETSAEDEELLEGSDWIEEDEEPEPTPEPTPEPIAEPEVLEVLEWIEEDDEIGELELLEEDTPAEEEYEDISSLVDRRKKRSEEKQQHASSGSGGAGKWLLMGGGTLVLLLLVGLGLYLIFPSGEDAEQVAETTPPGETEADAEASGPILIKPEVREPEPVEPQPVASKPVEPKPVVPQPVMPKPALPKPAVPKPVEPKLAKSKPVEPMPAKPKPVVPQPVEPKPDLPTPAAKPVAQDTSKKSEIPAVVKLKFRQKEPVTQPTMSPERYDAVTDSFRKMTNAFHNMADIYQGFMPDPKIYKKYYDEEGRLKVSWRVHLLPYLEEEVLYRRFKLDEPWDSPANKEAAKYMPDVYRSPETPADSNLTRFRGFEDLESVVPPATVGRARGRGASAVASIFTVGSKGRMRDIIDGSSNTIFFIEAGPDQAVEWTKPGELDLASASKSVGKTPLGIPTAFVDGRIRLLKSSIDDETWRSAIHPADRVKLDIDKLSLKIRRVVKVATPEKNLAQMQKISLGLRRFVDSHRRLPPASEHVMKGKQLLSWRVHLLPSLDAYALYAQFKLDEPWDSPHNIKLLELMPDVYECEGVTQPGMTSIMTFVGPGTPFQVDRPGPLYRQFRDGRKYTILFVKAGPDKAVPWTKPEDLPVDPEGPLKSLGTIQGDHFQAGIADGTVHEIKTDIPAETLKHLINHQDGKVVGDF
ncbi:DUF1559 family PulG-like putative transporter [Gimesia panareensis]|uniref:DUF1559 family PulG-like putative transporter n=1 Tax=Gimesia panareensis TaxID=2527978 RepID=UPI0011880149|nr:DUF1559 domain-containing protein [Gimesia panareensis]QDU47917.1 Filamentous hemagglutinin [Gimesia panareensis]